VALDAEVVSPADVPNELSRGPLEALGAQIGDAADVDPKAWNAARSRALEADRAAFGDEPTQAFAFVPADEPQSTTLVDDEAQQATDDDLQTLERAAQLAEAWQRHDTEQLVALLGEDELERQLAANDEWVASIVVDDDTELVDWLHSMRSTANQMRQRVRQHAAPAVRAPVVKSRGRARKPRRRRSGSSRASPARSGDDDPHEHDVAARARLGVRASEVAP
jgi:hypothetical protein